MEERIREYGERVIEEYDLDVSDVTYEFVVSGRLTRTHGNIRGNLRYDDYTIKVSSHAIDNFDWEHIKGVIRHELAHLVTYLERGKHSENDFFFQENLERLDAPKDTDRPAKPPKYILVCEDCGVKIRRQQKSKIIKNPHRYSCGECNGRLNRIK